MTALIPPRVFQQIKAWLETVTESPETEIHDPPPTVSEWTKRWLVTRLMWALFHKYPDDWDVFVGPVGTEPRDTWDTGGNVYDGFNADW